MASALDPIGLLRRIPFGEVMRLALFGLDERVSATKALQIGLVSEVVPRADLFARAQLLAARLAAKPPLAVQGTVKAIWDSLHMSAHGAREIPFLYPQLTNDRTKVGIDEVERPTWELR